MVSCFNVANVLKSVKNISAVCIDSVKHLYYKNIQRLKTVNYFRKNVHQRCLIGS